MGPENLTAIPEGAFFRSRSRPAAGAPGPSAEAAVPFAEGERLVHPVFGPGTVLQVKTDERCWVVQFDRLPTERNILFGAPLQRLGS
jgi:hypothetical protein